MLVLLERPSEYCVVSALGARLDIDQREDYGSRRLRHESKPFASSDAARAALDAAVARRVKARWTEVGRVDDPRIEAALARLDERAGRWSALAALDLDKGHAALSRSRPAGALQLANVRALRAGATSDMPESFQRFLRYTVRVGARCVFERGGCRSEVNSDVHGGYDRLQGALRERAPGVLGAGDLCIQDDLSSMERLTLERYDGAFSGAVLHPDGSITSWREGRVAGGHADFYAFFDDWIARVDRLIEDTWADVSRRA